MARLLKVLAGLVVLGGLSVGGYAWLHGRDSGEAAFETVAVTRGGIVEKAVAVGQIEPRLKFHIKSKISGLVERTAVEVGDRVAAGDLLLDIAPDPTPSERVEAERHVERAESAFRRAEADWTRTRELVEEGIVSRDQLDARQEGFELARIELARARDGLQLLREGRIAGRGQRLESTVRSPARGIVLERHVNPGDPVVPLTSYQEGTALVTIADMDDLVFRGTVDEIDVGKLVIGMPARLKIGAIPDALVTGKLSRIAPQATEKDNAKLFEVEIELDPAAETVLRAGYSANADVVIREKSDVLLVPERLVTFEEDGAKAFVELPPETPEGQPRKVEIRPGLSDGLNLEVVEGLDEGARVVERPPRDVVG